MNGLMSDGDRGEPSTRTAISQRSKRSREIVCTVGKGPPAGVLKAPKSKYPAWNGRIVMHDEKRQRAEAEIASMLAVSSIS